ncbi:hypothetical protein [Okeania sp. KiyG1]|uniref:hypothetical protein n=1 Tax=Okeania sp. KiyG1 TaxID=2720165 RepID=UPI0019247FE4|nr:hypothetical protein [Okeania sp. KiyG1]
MTFDFSYTHLILRCRLWQLKEVRSQKSEMYQYKINIQEVSVEVKISYFLWQKIQHIPPIRSTEINN